jgi:phage replication-related protein YjqB (UPF0714/DUF867 family)
MDKYATYAQLKRNEIEDRDYTILYRDLSSQIVIMAPHGGGIEPGTIDIADELAGCEYTFYGFKGLKKTGNSILYINSNNFDEPISLKAAHDADIVMSIHGAKDKAEMVCVGGVNSELKRIIIHTLKAAGFNAVISRRPGLQGNNPENICNRCKTKKGVQLEISRGLRETLFENLSNRSLRKKTKTFYQFVNTLREALKLFVAKYNISTPPDLKQRGG